MKCTLEQRLRKAQVLFRKYWALACEHAGIPADSPYVQFGSDNPYAARSNLAAALFGSLLDQVQQERTKLFREQRPFTPRVTMGHYRSAEENR